MSDLEMQVLVSRELLMLDPLDINDYEFYYCAPQFLGAAVTWVRQQATSPWTDGAVTTNRQRGMVQEQIAVEILGDDMSDFRANWTTIVDAFMQDSFTLDVTVDGEEFKYQCEAADVLSQWVGSRFIARQTQVVFTVPRQPVPLIGRV